MSYKVTKANEAYTYEAPGHYDVRTTRLHDPKDVNEGQIIMGMSHFLPGGGCEMGANPLEFIYYIVEGEMTVELEDQKIVLKTGDSIHCGAFTKKAIVNTGVNTCRMLVVLRPPVAK